MFDWYEPCPPIQCPLCGEDLEGWQGKDGENWLFVYRQGHSHAVQIKGADETFNGELRDIPVPRGPFGLYTECSRGHWVNAVGETDDEGVWTRTQVSGTKRSPG